MVEISVIIPVLNEEDNISMLYKRISHVLSSISEKYELIFINDGSKDTTLQNIKTLHLKDDKVKYIDFARNFGHQIAVSAGIDAANGQVAVIIDADLQDPPELIPEMYSLIKDGYEVVYAQRAKRKGDTFFKKISALLFYHLLNFLSTIDIPLDTGDFRIIDRKVIEVLRNMPEKHKFLRGQISWIGFRQTSVYYERDKRYAGSTKYPFRKMLRFALDGITGFSTLPLKFATVSGFFTSFVAFLLMIWVFFVRIFGSKFGLYIQPGWASQMIVILFLGGIQLIGIGILGEYIGRINENIKDRPLYIVRQKSDGIL